MTNGSPKKGIRLTPRGVSGLKLFCASTVFPGMRSHPSRGEWIEIWPSAGSGRGRRCLTPRGVSGLKCHNEVAHFLDGGLTPRGVSGLKSVCFLQVPDAIPVSPLAG